MISYLLLKIENALNKLSRSIKKIRYKIMPPIDHEKEFWKQEIEHFKIWYEGKKLFYNKRYPEKDEQIKNFDFITNATITFRKFSFDKYTAILKIEKEIYKGKRILDIGCGPMGYAEIFEGADIYGLDRLSKFYKKIGLCKNLKMKLIQGTSENMPFNDNFFDAVIAVNSLDHVSNFEKTCKEIKRVLNPSGLIRFQIHYHKKNKSHPLEINESIIYQNLHELKIKPIHEESLPPEDKFYLSDLNEKSVIWSNF